MRSRLVSIRPGLVLVGVAAFAFAGVAEAKNVRWNLSLWGKKRASTSGAHAVVEDVEAKSGGSFKIKIHYGSLSKPKENLDGIKIGAFQMATFCAAYHPDKTPTLSVLDLPFLPYKDFDAKQATHEAVYAHPAVVKDLARWNAKILMTSMLPEYEMMGKGKPPRSAADLKGMRVRALGGIGVAMKNMGAVPTTVPAPEVYNMISTGAVDGVTFPFTYAHAAYKVHEVSEWFTSNMSLGSVTCPLVINTKAWSKLSKEHQDILWNARLAGYDEYRTVYKKADAKNLPMFRAKLTEIKLSEPDLAALRKAGAKPVWDKWVQEASGKGLPAQELLDLVMSKAKGM
ncbi:MAG: C4-dicarboxylate TRAP transporter substrate-binding protein [Alphaproteobacteria bacterium]|nr:C4-dicarboxylate TRAP transporter substrate-binding protein [Alphaproteobacteria bacterium]MDP6565587.1 C4-dicarboxylate TRAP transporter substrate-binding protein [Alphaproteobacteria bacterium]MDP6814626.1 C4-dicarboxylate TRAP transporter substrate-binding protein [Alphaproteobacteria bacterium]